MFAFCLLAGCSSTADDTRDKGTESAPEHATVGKKAPNFTLPNLEGKKVSLYDYLNKDDVKYVVLEWMNPDCPYCTRVHESGIVGDMLENVRNMTDGKVVHLEINSTHYMSPEKTKKYLKEHGIESTALMDNSGKVGKTYRAKTTPHMFVIDQEGIIRYAGAIDNDVKGKKPPEDTVNYVVKAIKHLENGKDVSPKKTKPYGCSVKYPKN